MAELTETEENRLQRIVNKNMAYVHGINHDNEYPVLLDDDITIQDINNRCDEYFWNRSIFPNGNPLAEYLDEYDPSNTGYI